MEDVQITNKIAAIVTIYYPNEEEVIANIKSYLLYVNLLYIVDNTAVGSRSIIESFAKQNIGKVIYIKSSTNLGIGTAINMAASKVYANSYRWILTMDQDSSFSQHYANEYFSFFEQYFSNLLNVAIVAPTHHKLDNVYDGEHNYKELNSVITSGSLVNLNIWNTLGGYNEELFIDEIDHEYCYRAVCNKYKIIEMQHVNMNHQLGFKNKVKLFGGLLNFERSVHIGKRNYYIVRNYLYLRKIYKHQFDAEFKMRDKKFFHEIKNNILFSGHFFENLKYVCRGLWHFFTSKFPVI